MADVQFLNAAVSDLDDIDDFSVALFGEHVAESYMRGFDDAFRQLTHLPNLGRIEPTLGKDIRCLSHRHHRIFYRIDGSTVIVIRIFHQSRDARRALKQ